MSQARSEMVALNADVVGYSRLIADDLEAMTATMEEYRDLVERRVGDNGGTLVNFVGDNFMAVFADAMDAMRTAIAVTTEIETRNATRAISSRARFRMGMDQGIVAVSGDEYFGDALNIAARIQALARPGGISVSGRVYRALDEPALRFQAPWPAASEGHPRGGGHLRVRRPARRRVRSVGPPLARPGVADRGGPAHPCRDGRRVRAGDGRDDPNRPDPPAHANAAAEGDRRQDRARQRRCP